MGTFEIIVTVVCFIAYTVFAVWAVRKFKRLSTGIFGSVCLAAGSVGVYFITSLVTVILLWLLKALLVVAVIAMIIHFLGG